MSSTPLAISGTGDLLHRPDEQFPLAAAALVQIGRAFQEQQIADEIEDRRIARRVAAFGLRTARQIACQSRSGT